MAESFLIWPWKPQNKITESLEWYTDIIQAKDTSEQRIRLRVSPRQSSEVEVQTDDTTELARINLAVTGWQDQLYGWGVWHEHRALAASLSSGAGSIPIDTAYADYRDDSWALLWESLDKYEAVEIDTVGAASITLKDATANEYSAGSLVMPMRLVRMAEKVSRDDFSTNLTKFKLALQCTDNIDLVGSASAMQYLGYDVLSDPILLPGVTVPRQIERALEVFDPGIGEWTADALSDYPEISSELRWRPKTAAQVWAMRLFLHRRCGRLVPVWIPSWRDDLILADTVIADDPVIAVNDASYRILGINQPTKQHVAIFADDGSFVCREITAAVAGDPGEENLTLDTAIGFTDVSRISFLSLQRFAADKIQLSWQRPGVAETRTSMIEVAQ